MMLIMWFTVFVASKQETVVLNIFWKVKIVSVQTDAQEAGRETVIENQNKAYIFLSKRLVWRGEWTAVLNQITSDVIPCSIEERLDISIVKTKKSEGKRKRMGQRE